jgi:hypothetical protein
MTKEVKIFELPTLSVSLPMRAFEKRAGMEANIQKRCVGFKDYPSDCV